MSKYTYVEELFIDFVKHTSTADISIDSADSKPCNDFYLLMIRQEALTHPQSLFIIRLLSKYRKSIESLGLDTDIIDAPKWRSQFRVIDHSKKIFLEKSNNDELLICVKHPYSFKESFEKSCERIQMSHREAQWDSQERVKKYTLDAVNVIAVKEYAQQKRYEMSVDFLDLVEYVEQTYEDQDRYLPSCNVEDGKVVIINAIEPAERYFREHQKGNIIDDLFLAKSMGYVKLYHGKSIAEKICATQNNFFWIKQTRDFLDLVFGLSGKTVITLTKDQPKQWIEKFLIDLVSAGYDPSTCKVGFRASNVDDPDFNKWIKERNLGGDLRKGKILIFKDKPPKWLLEDHDDVSIVASSGAFMPSSSVAQSWISQMPCVIFLGEVKPSMTRGFKIVEL